MAQSSVAREPSMEEILASIRKIIESNEPGAGKSISTSLPPVYEMSEEDADDIHLTIDDELADVELDDVPLAPQVAVDPRFVAANSSGQQRETAPENRTLSLADVAARVRAASERNAAHPAVVRETPQPRELPPEMAARLAEVRFSHLEPQSPTAIAEEPATAAVVAAAEAAMQDVSLAEVAPQSSGASEIESAQPTPQPEDVVVQMRPVEPAPQVAVEVEPQMQAPQQTQPQPAAVAEPERLPPTPVFAEAPRPQQFQPQPAPVAVAPDVRFLPQVQEEVHRSLLSAAAGEQVARSFDELAVALGQEHRSLDEIAEDMLRPMLQEWLDDNLPTLVERLVREEIERVARGPRR